MPTLVWDNVADRVYEFGLDRGVLYLPDGTGIPWNGLTSVVEKFDRSVNPIYFDGMKIQDATVLGDFAGTMKAITFPEEFTEMEGLGSFSEGVFLGDQPSQVFGLSYRTKIGNDLDYDAGYKIHVLYNVTATPNDKNYATVSDSLSLVEFEWDLFAVPEEVPGFRPTAHVIVDTRRIEPGRLIDLEEILYGTDLVPATLPAWLDLIGLLSALRSLLVDDLGDGSWIAESEAVGVITFDDIDDDIFFINHTNAVYLDSDTFEISDT